MSTEHPVDYVDEESARRIAELEEPFQLGHRYARVDRGTLMPDGRPETDGEHAISIAIAGTCYATKYHPELDPYKVFFELVMHDIDEHLEGDTPTIGATEESLAIKDESEMRGAAEVDRILSPFPIFLEMVHDMHDLRNPETQFGKAMDKLAPGFTHEANQGQILREIYGLTSYEELLKSVELTDKKMYDYAAHLVDVIAMRQEMHRKVSRVAFQSTMWVDEPLFEM
jgi:5'-deoxynucleotidase YfbR-like HD superfamily hydrolase